MAWDPLTQTWTNSGYWEQTTAVARLTMARAFVTELQNAITARGKGNGEEIDPTTIVQLLQIVKSDLPKLEKEANVDSGVGLPRMISTVTRDFRNQ
jgi:hypothetical protein